jgi:hypothetical protein
VCEAAKKQLETEGKLSENQLKAAPTADMQPQQLLESPSATPEPEPKQEVTASPSVQNSPAAAVNRTSSSASDVANMKADNVMLMEVNAKMAEMKTMNARMESALERIENKSTTCSLM